MDRLSPQRRSWNMSRIRGRDTKPELVVRSFLHRRGLRFRLHRAGLPGRPDIVLASSRTAVFVHGCFWHRHTRCRFAYTPKSNLAVWEDKFAKNVERDKRALRTLRSQGWRAVVVWACQVGDIKLLEQKIVISHQLARKHDFCKPSLC